jgi:hypothetical protein
MRDLACWEDGEHSSIPEVDHGIANRPAIAFEGVICLERINEDAVPLKLRYIREQIVRKEFHVRSNTCKQYGEDCPIQHTIRMIRNHHYRTFGWDAGLISRIKMQVDLHGGEQILQAKALGRTLHAIVQVSHPCYWS